MSINALRNQWCAISVASEKEWKAFANNRPSGEWTNSEKYSSTEARVGNQKELDERISRWTRQKTAKEVGELLQAAGVSGCRFKIRRIYSIKTSI